MPRYALLTVDGKDLGTMALGRPDWPTGSILYLGKSGKLRVVRLVQAEHEGHLDVLVVEEIS